MLKIPFITAGFPTPDTFWDVLLELQENGADIIEIGVPFSDPVADGPVIEAASRQALADGITLSWILEGLRQRKGQFTARLVLMGYMNPFLRYGFERLAKEAEELGMYGLIIPDLPLDESAPYRAIVSAHGIHLIPLIAINTLPERMRAYAAVSTGYVYLVSVLGTTGERTDFPPELVTALREVRKHFAIPVALGFGISNAQQLAAIPPDAHPDGIIFGSALLRHLAEGKSAADFMRDFLLHRQECL